MAVYASYAISDDPKADEYSMLCCNTNYSIPRLDLWLVIQKRGAYEIEYQYSPNAPLFPSGSLHGFYMHF